MKATLEAWGERNLFHRRVARETDGAPSLGSMETPNRQLSCQRSSQAYAAEMSAAHLLQGVFMGQPRKQGAAYRRSTASNNAFVHGTG
jgi:hypothetical protein